MKLRDAPRTSYHTIPNWPPIWLERYGGGERLRGEIGVLKYSAQDSNPKKARYYLYITYNNTPYVGSLLFDDMAFCRTISDILKTRIGEEISQIGNLDLSHTL